MKSRPLNKRKDDPYTYYRIKRDTHKFYRMKGEPTMDNPYQTLYDGTWINWSYVSMPHVWIKINKKDIKFT